jgi:acyl carrier protein
MAEEDHNMLTIIRSFVVNELAAVKGIMEVTADESLIDTDILDSMGVVQLVTYLEEKFDIRFGDDEITAENFGTLNAINNLVSAKVISRGNDI